MKPRLRAKTKTMLHSSWYAKSAGCGHDGTDIKQDMLPSVNDSVIGHRIIGETYLEDEDYENVLQVAENGLEVLRSQEIKRGIKLHA